MVFKTRAEERADHVQKFYNIWKETGWENTFRLMGIENTRYNRQLWGDTFRRYKRKNCELQVMPVNCTFMNKYHNYDQLYNQII